MRTVIKEVESGEMLISIEVGVPASKELRIKSCSEIYEVVEVVHNYDLGRVVQIVYVHSCSKTLAEQIASLQEQTALRSSLTQLVHQILRVAFDLQPPLTVENYQDLTDLAHQVALDLTKIEDGHPDYSQAIAMLCSGYEEELKIFHQKSHRFADLIVHFVTLLKRFNVQFRVTPFEQAVIAQAHGEMALESAKRSC